MGIIALIFILFCYFRLKPIYFQTVGFTYDQGRDFLKAAEIVLYKNPTFIGPTTGIDGIFHGAWWYYLLTLPFVLFKGLPIGFYYFSFFFHLASFVGLFFILKKYFDLLTSFIITLLISVSGYFIFTSIFVGNNIMVLPFLLLFLIVNFLLLEKKTDKWFIFIFLGLSLGMVAEFEFAFGLFLVPSYFILIPLFKNLRLQLFKIPNGILFLSSLGIVFIPRMFFELKHNFSQTRTLINFLFKPKLYNPKPYIDVLKDRIMMFYGYYRSLFPNDFLFFAITFFVVLSVLLVIMNKGKIYKNAIKFLLMLLLLLFLFSTLYKDNFWGNYYEGIQYIFIFVIAIFFAIIPRRETAHNFFLFLKVVIFICLFFIGLNMFLPDIGKPVKEKDLVVQIQTVDYIHSIEKDSSAYCVKVYTPPVIPYTYDYLFLSKRIANNIPEPKKEFVNGSCWFILEYDDFKERREKWIRENIAHDAVRLQYKKFPNNTEVILYKNRTL